MTDFLMLFRGGDEEVAKFSPEAMQQHLQQWGQWIESLSQQGKFKAGDPLGRSGRVVSGGGQVTDGPYAEAKDLVGGYVLVTAETLDEATELAKGCPIYKTGGTTEVRPIQSL